MLRCVICKSGDVKAGSTGFTVERGNMTLVLKGVPAHVCGQCGEAYFDEATTKRVEALVEQAEHTGVHLAVQDYITA